MERVMGDGEEQDRDGGHQDVAMLTRVGGEAVPGPRTVSISRSCPVGSSAFLSRRMCTSTVRSSTNTWSPQT